jgi:hypothetical protein
MISYRGHSENPGKADQKTIIHDVMGTILEIMNNGYQAENVYLEGSSLGTSVLAHSLKKYSTVIIQMFLYTSSMVKGID